MLKEDLYHMANTVIHRIHEVSMVVEDDKKDPIVLKKILKKEGA